jgi:hypothetical protein
VKPVPGHHYATIEPDAPCPTPERHTRVPDGYLERVDDARARLGRGQYQERCPGCGLWKVWKTRGGTRARGSRA